MAKEIMYYLYELKLRDYKGNLDKHIAEWVEKAPIFVEVHKLPIYKE